MLVRKTPFGEGDVVATLFTDSSGQVAGLVRGARQSKKGAFGAVEPFHTLKVSYAEGRGELVRIREARIERPRLAIAQSLDRMEAAGRAMRWLRAGAPTRQPEPELWEATIEVLDALDDPDALPLAALARYAARIATALGYELELERCIVCGADCPPGRSAALDVARGGIVCQRCGGARRLIQASDREACLRAMRGGVIASDDAAKRAIDVLSDVMSIHLGKELD